METLHSRGQLEREERLLLRRLEEVRRQLDAYDAGEAVHVETYHAYKERTGEE
jgi:ribosomal protein L21E